MHWFRCFLLFFLQYVYSLSKEEYPATINVRRKNNFLIDSAENLNGLYCRLFAAWCFCLVEVTVNECVSCIVSWEIPPFAPCLSSHLSDSVQLLSGSVRLQPVSHRRPKVRLCLVCRCRRLSLRVSGLVFGWGQTHLPRSGHPLCKIVALLWTLLRLSLLERERCVTTVLSSV